MIIHNQNNIPVPLGAGAAPGYNGPVIRGTRMLAAVTAEYEICVQEFMTACYGFSYNWLRFTGNELFTFFSDRKGLHGRVMIENDVTHQHVTFGDITVHQGEAMLAWAGESECRSSFQPGKTYVSLDFYTSPEFIAQLSDFFPELRDTIVKGKSRLITERPCFITPSMKDIIRQMIEHPYDEASSAFYFDTKVKEILFALLQQHYSRVKSEVVFSEYERNRIYTAREKLLENLAIKRFTIEELARHAGINSCKLKQGFRQFFGMGILQSLKEKRLQYARELLLNTNKPMKEISRLAGYKQTTSFITSFRKRFGYPPGNLRRS